MEGVGRLVGLARRSKVREPMQEVEEGEIHLDTGFAGDIRGGRGERQVTILFLSDWEAACASLGETRPWTLRRANLLITGLANPRAPGGRLRVGEAELSITGETEPCSRMDAQWPGLTAALTPEWRGGLTARVVRSGHVRRGDGVLWET